MAKIDIRKKSVEEIIADLGIWMRQDELYDVVNDWDLLHEDLIQEDFKLEVKSYLIEHSSNVNKEKLVFVTLRNLKNNVIPGKKLVSNTGLLGWDLTKYNDYVDALKKSKIEVPKLVLKEGGYEVGEFEDISVITNEKKDPKEELNLKKHNKQVLLNVEEKIKLDYLLSMIQLKDLEEFVCLYKGNGSFFRNLILDNARAITNFEIDQRKQNGEDITEEKENRIYYRRLIQQTKETFEKYIEKFNIEKFLLLAAYRAKCSFEKSDNRSNIMLEIMKVANENIVDPKLKIEGTSNIPQKHFIKYSKKDLAQDGERIVGDEYFSRKELLDMREQLLSGQMELSQVNNKKVFELLDFSSRQKLELINKDAKNFEKLIAFGTLEEEEIKQALAYIRDLKIDKITLESLYGNEHIDKNDVISLYMKNNIDLSSTLNFGKMRDLNSEVTVEELMRYYQERKESPEKEKKFNRYNLLFRELKIKGKEPEEQQEVAGQIAMQVCELESEYDEFKRLYEVGLLPIETLIEWNGNEIIYDLIKNSSLKPKDAKNLLITKTLDLGKTCDALKKSNLSNEEKLTFIFSSFNNIGENKEEIKLQNHAKMYLLQAINLTNDGVHIEKNTMNTTKRVKSGVTEPTTKKRYVTDPGNRWDLFFELDEDHEIKLYPDGTAKVMLPNLNKVLFEKLFKSTKKETKINYGTATFVMDREEFYNHKEEIEVEGELNSEFLKDMRENGMVDRVCHFVNWGKSLKKKLNISQENSYSPEKMKKIDELIERIQKSREIMD